LLLIEQHLKCFPQLNLPVLDIRLALATCFDCLAIFILPVHSRGNCPLGYCQGGLPMNSLGLQFIHWKRIQLMQILLDALPVGLNLHLNSIQIHLILTDFCVCSGKLICQDFSLLYLPLCLLFYLGERQICLLYLMGCLFLDGSS